MKNASQLINQDSGDAEYYTPQFIVEVAREAMGGIDLDPASSEAANKRVSALQIFTETDDGLSKEWFGRVWMNHPFSREGNRLWINKMVEEFESGRTIKACCITFAATSEKWFQPLLKRPQCFLSPRTNYHLPDGSLKRGVTKGSVVTFFGIDMETIQRTFSHLGVCK